MKILRWLFGKSNTVKSNTDTVFKVKIKYYAGGKYKVLYKEKGDIFYKSLVYFFGLGYPSCGQEGIYADLFDIEKAQKVAESIKSIEDVNNYNQKAYNEAKEWHKGYREWKEKNIPFYEKNM